MPKGPLPRGPPAPEEGEGKLGPARGCRAGLGLKTALSLFSALKSPRFLLENIFTRGTGPNRPQGRPQNNEPAGRRARHPRELLLCVAGTHTATYDAIP